MVEILKYNGKEYPIRVKYYALMMFKKETGASFDSLQKTAKQGAVDLAAAGLDEFTMMEPLLYYSLISGLKAVDKKAKLDLERDDMFSMLEDCFMDFCKLMPKFFPEDKNKEIQTGEDNDSVKKLPGNRHQKKIQEKIMKKKKKLTNSAGTTQ